MPGPSLSPVPAASTGHEAHGEAGAMVLVLNSGSSSVKFALLHPGSGQRAVSGLAEKVGTAEAVLHLRRGQGDPATEPLDDGSCKAVIARILDYLPGAGSGPAAMSRPWPASATGWYTAARGSPTRWWWTTR